MSYRGEVFDEIQTQQLESIRQTSGGDLLIQLLEEEGGHGFDGVELFDEAFRDGGNGEHLDAEVGD